MSSGRHLSDLLSSYVDGLLLKRFFRLEFTNERCCEGISTACVANQVQDLNVWPRTMIICDSRSLSGARFVGSVGILSIEGAMYVRPAPSQYFHFSCSIHLPERKCWILFLTGKIKCWSGLASQNTNFGQVLAHKFEYSRYLQVTQTTLAIGNAVLDG